MGFSTYSEKAVGGLFTADLTRSSEPCRRGWFQLDLESSFAFWTSSFAIPWRIPIVPVAAGNRVPVSVLCTEFAGYIQSRNWSFQPKRLQNGYLQFDGELRLGAGTFLDFCNAGWAFFDFQTGIEYNQFIDDFMLEIRWDLYDFFARVQKNA